jgi:transcriptional regulator with XRE-family HTH domain
VSIGEVLATARLDAGMTVSDVSDRTRITRTIITAIEGDDYAGCGGDFYARGHIRSIARAVGTDPEPLIREYDGAQQEQVAAEEFTEQKQADIGQFAEQEEAGSGLFAEQEQADIGHLAEPITPAGRFRRPRRPPIWQLAVAAGLVAAVGLTGFLLANRTHGFPPAAGPASATPSPTAAQSGHPASSAPAAAAAVPLRILHPVSAAAIGFAGRSGDHGELARLAIDRNPATAWNTDWYATARFGNLYPGTGLLVDMGRPVTIKAVRLTLSRAAGASLQIRVGPAPALASLRTVAKASDVGGVVHVRITRPAKGRYVLVWFNQLPPDPSGTFRESVYGVQLRGRN